MVTIYLSLDEKGLVTGWGSNEAPDTVPIELEEDHEFFTWYTKFRYEDGKLVEDYTNVIRDLKIFKTSELKSSCRTAIEEGFVVEIRGQLYHFSYSPSDQYNIKGNKDLLEYGIEDEVIWTVREGSKEGPIVRIPLNLEEITKVYFTGIQHKNKQTAILHDYLLPLLEVASNLEGKDAVDAMNKITWDYEPEEQQNEEGSN